MVLMPGNFGTVHRVARAHSKGARLGESGGYKRNQEIQAMMNERKKRTKKILRTYDKNRNKQLEHGELKQMMSEQVKEEVPDSDVEYYLKRFDNDASGGVKKAELQDLLLCFGLYWQRKDEAHALMKKYDVNKTSSLDRGELKAMMEELFEGMSVTEEDLDFVIQEADILGDGKIDEPEIVRAVAMIDVRLEQNKQCCTFL